MRQTIPSVSQEQMELLYVTQPVWKADKSPLKLNIHISYNPAMPLLQICLKEEHHMCHKDMYKNVHSGTAYSSQNQENQVSIIHRGDKYIVIYLYMESYPAMKMETVATCDSIDDLTK